MYRTITQEDQYIVRKYKCINQYRKINKNINNRNKDMSNKNRHQFVILKNQTIKIYGQ